MKVNDSARRFLALNCVLNGHSFFAAFDNDPSLAAKCLGKDTQTLVLLNMQLQHLEEIGHIDIPIDIRVALNFIRTAEYAFITPPGNGAITVRDMAVSDRNGDIDDALRRAILIQLIRDIAFVEDEKETRISDGTFFLKGPRSPEDVMNIIQRAYELYRDGPKGGVRALVKSGEQFTVEGYKDFSANTCYTLLSKMVTTKIAPTDYRDTTLFIPDLLPIYEASGCIIVPSTTEQNNLIWLLDVKDSKECYPLSVEKAKVRSLLIEDAHSLANIEYDASLGPMPFSIKDGGRQ